MKQIIFLICLSTTACSTTPRLNWKSENSVRALTSLKPGISTRQEVEKGFGPPEYVESLSQEPITRFMYGVVVSHNVRAPQVTIAIDKKTEKVAWITYGDFHEVLTTPLVEALFPNAHFSEMKRDSSKLHYVPYDKIYEDKQIGVSYSWRPNFDVDSITWGLPESRIPATVEPAQK